jgi:biotin-dependent carboxylase-like uncharacterized protein
MTSGLKVLSGGLSTTVQDAGRLGRYAIGMPPSGAMDQYSYRVANLLVGNDEEAAALEATYVGPTLEFADDRLVAVTGGQAGARLNGDEIASWEPFPVKAGDTLSFSMITAGARPYIAVSGGVDVPTYLGSRSTYTLIGLGGFEGRKLADGDELPLGAANGRGRAGSRIPDHLMPTFGSDIEVRTVVGLCSYRLTETALESFLTTPWKVTKDAVSGTGCAAATSTSSSVSSRSVPVATPRTSWTWATRSDRSRCPEAMNPSSCSATRSRVAAT